MFRQQLLEVRLNRWCWHCVCIVGCLLPAGLELLIGRRVVLEVAEVQLYFSCAEVFLLFFIFLLCDHHCREVSEHAAYLHF